MENKVRNKYETTLELAIAALQYNNLYFDTIYDVAAAQYILNLFVWWKYGAVLNFKKYALQKSLK